MVEINVALSTVELMKLAGDNHQKIIELTDAQKDQLFELLKERGRSELEYGEELEIDNIKLIRRVTGSVGIYFT